MFQVKKMTTTDDSTRARVPLYYKPSDDEAIEWWESFEELGEIHKVAKRHGVQKEAVFLALDELGVFEDTSALPRGAKSWRSQEESLEGVRQSILNRARAGALTDRELAIMDAVGTLEPSDDYLFERRTVPFAKSMQHHTPSKGPVVMSARQRAQDKMLGGPNGKLVKTEMAAAGLLPRQIRSGGSMYFH